MTSFTKCGQKTQVYRGSSPLAYRVGKVQNAGLEKVFLDRVPCEIVVNAGRGNLLENGAGLGVVLELSVEMRDLELARCRVAMLRFRLEREEKKNKVSFLELHTSSSPRPQTTLLPACTTRWRTGGFRFCIWGFRVSAIARKTAPLVGFGNLLFVLGSNVESAEVNVVLDGELHVLDRVLHACWFLHTQG